MWWPSYSVLLSRAYHVGPDRQFSKAKSPRCIENLFLSKIQIGGPHSLLLYFSSPFFHFTYISFWFLFSFIFLIGLCFFFFFFNGVVVQIGSAFLFRRGGKKIRRKKEKRFIAHSGNPNPNQILMTTHSDLIVSSEMRDCKSLSSLFC